MLEQLDEDYRVIIEFITLGSFKRTKQELLRTTTILNTTKIHFNLAE